MKKKTFFPIILCLVLVIGFLGFIVWNNRTVSTITLDINPSVEINLKRNEKVKNVIALNEDAKEIIDANLEGKKLDETLKLICDNLIEKGYARTDDLLEIIVYSEGNTSNKELETKIKETFNENQIDSNIITIDDISKEDKELAKEYNISPAKVVYIKSIAKDNDNIDIEDYSNKPVAELKEIKETGNYCDKGYTLEGNLCFREIGKKTPKSGETCPQGYLEYNKSCYREVGIMETGNISCPTGFTLEGEDCIKKKVVSAIVTDYSCPSGIVKTKAEVGMSVKGSGDSNDPVCVDPSSITHPVTVCELPASDPTERLSYGGKCYWHRAPVIDSGCPGKIKVNGFCWDLATNVYLCPNSENKNPRTKDDYCYKVLKNVKPIAGSYKCENEGWTLEGSKCTGVEKSGIIREITCPDEYTLIDNNKCLNLSDKKNKVNGLICDEENTRLEGNDCIVYEQVEAKHN